MKSWENEIWLPVIGWQDVYEVSNFGRIRSIPRQIVYLRGFVRNYNNYSLLSPYDGDEYFYVNLSKNQKRERTSIHRLVGIHFVPNPFKKPEINHLDGNKKNNHYLNLEWTTRKENDHHSVKNGLKWLPSRNGKNVSKPIIQLDLNGVFIREWPSIKEAVRAGFNNGNLSQVLNNKAGRTQHRGYKWKFL